MHTKSNPRWLRAGLRSAVLALLSLVICACGHAQTKNSKGSGDAAAANAIYSQGIAALQGRDLAGAREAFEKTVRLVPESPEPHNSLGWVLLAQGETDAAIAEFGWLQRTRRRATS
jgi:Tfp pilus assembly protein PilF